MERGAGMERFSDMEYINHGAEIVPNVGDLYSKSDIILKVRAPTDTSDGHHEAEYLRKYVYVDVSMYVYISTHREVLCTL